MKGLEMLKMLVPCLCFGTACFVPGCSADAPDPAAQTTEINKATFPGFNRDVTIYYQVSFDNYTPKGKEAAPNYVVDEFQRALNTPTELTHVVGQSPTKFFGYKFAEGSQPDVVVQMHIHCDESNNFTGRAELVEPSMGVSINITPGGAGAPFRDPSILIDKCADILNSFVQYGGHWDLSKDYWMPNGYPGFTTHDDR